MYLSKVEIENFRIFGARSENKHLCVELHKGLNLFVGENDSGKSAIIDAIRYALWTNSQEFQRVNEDDFHVSENKRAKEFSIKCFFNELSENETARFLEWLSIEDNKPCLYVTFKATRIEEIKNAARRRNFFCTTRAGKEGDGPTIEGNIRDFLKITYLKPLRDAEEELSAGYNSRLTQILYHHPSYKDEIKGEHDGSLIKVMREAESKIEESKIIKETKEEINTDLDRLSLGNDLLMSDIKFSRKSELRDILEKLELVLNSPTEIGLETRRGLGLNNILFMATELLLLSDSQEEALPLLLVEEPEAHLHPQLQLRLMEFLEKKENIQILLTSHSPNLASKVAIEKIFLVAKGRTYSLAENYTKLDKTDYLFLRRFLDVTKANLFFAKGIVIVEGAAENILLPVLAEMIGLSFSKHGVSIINVGSVGLFRYSRIFQRRDNRSIPIRVACIRDLDIPTDEAQGFLRTNRRGDRRKTASDYTDEKRLRHINKIKKIEEDGIRIFISPQWTLEHDLAEKSRRSALLICQAIDMSKIAKKKGIITDELKNKILEKSERKIIQWESEGKNLRQIASEIYKPIYQEQVSKPEVAQFLTMLWKESNFTVQEIRDMLPEYLIQAIEFVTDQKQVTPAQNVANSTN